MKLTLLFPRFNYRNFALPLGTLYIASILKQNNFDFTFIDGTVTSFEKALEQVINEKPDYLLVSLQTVFADFAFDFINQFKQACPDSKVVVGGVHATIFPEQTLNENGVDFVVIGEGEQTLIELLKQKTLNEIQGLGFKLNNQIKINARREPIQELDKIPFPSRELLDSAYFKTGSTALISSRGCPFQCAFCQPTLDILFGKKFRTRSVENTISEIKEAVSIYEKKGFALKEFGFTDDGLTYNKKWLFELCTELIKQEIKLPWSANSRADTMPDFELLSLMKKAGCTKISIGVESGNDFIRNKILRKNVSKEQLITAFSLCHQAEIEAHAYLMVGSPDESFDSILDTVKLLDLIKPDFTQVTLTSPLPKTFLFDYCDENKLAEIKNWSDYGYGDESHLKLKNFSSNEIKRIQKALTYAIVFHKKFSNLTYLALFKFFMNPLVNKSFILMQSARFNLKKIFGK